MKKALFIGGIVVIVCAIGVLIFIYSGRSFLNNVSSANIGNLPAAVAVPFTDIARGAQSSISTRTNYLITSTSELEKLWKLIDAGGKPPSVDFTQNYIAAIFAGDKPTDGYAISVAKVEDTTLRTITTTLAEPGTQCTPKRSATSPYEIISLPKTSLPFTHEDQTMIVECTQ